MHTAKITVINADDVRHFFPAQSFLPREGHGRHTRNYMGLGPLIGTVSARARV